MDDETGRKNTRPTVDGVYTLRLDGNKVAQYSVFKNGIWHCLKKSSDDALDAAKRGVQSCVVNHGSKDFTWSLLRAFTGSEPGSSDTKTVETPWLPPVPKGFGPWIMFSGSECPENARNRVVARMYKTEQANKRYFHITAEVNSNLWGHVAAYCVKLDGAAALEDLVLREVLRLSDEFGSDSLNTMGAELGMRPGERWTMVLLQRAETRLGQEMRPGAPYTYREPYSADKARDRAKQMADATARMIERDGPPEKKVASTPAPGFMLPGFRSDEPGLLIVAATNHRCGGGWGAF